ncbi:hypothetical protein CK203_015814 [Vitis vinifera]|uniref:Uncharacterized protein n=1 Tax=Vitis vinifera TaxID=29760 RepID=A0A438JRK8_VITVI|nr:hypothetical protein CK203_015814 [Vitis vinifera]
MWFKVKGFKDLLRSWWQVVVRSSASFRLAAKMKELKQELKVWNRDVFGRLECNKALALQQVEVWDQLDQLSHQEAENLEIPFSEEEVHFALMDMNGDKAPAPMTSQWLFGKTTHKPVGGLYKLLAKVLANRLKRVIGKVVSSDQNAFVMVFYESYAKDGFGSRWLDGCGNASLQLNFQFVNGSANRRVVEGQLRRVQNLGKKKVGSLPSSYLGLPLRATNKALSMWDGVEERVRRRLRFGNINIYPKVSSKKVRKIAKRLPVGRGKLGEEMFTVGNGTKIRFGLTIGVAVTTLSQSFPQLFIMAAHTIAIVEEMWDQNFGQGGWNLRFLRDFNDWKLDLVGNLLHVLRGYRLTLEEDSVSWKGGSNRQFRVKERTTCCEPNRHRLPELIAFGWMSSNQNRFFCLEATWGRCLLQIGSRNESGNSLIIAFCVVVKKKTVNHILIHCITARVLWKIVLCLFGVQWFFQKL